ncbi:hypothetical protein [Polluticoccus soli]|uniref:hypothetical protein n=1 Tax=Polluticoccus soli TaxID=3034150 RepID=UPI0023E2D9EC|nr:hypothetical protein [Flavipsychrobacter sp. JY13-12]
MKLNFPLYTAAVFVALLSLSACKKDRTSDNTPTTQEEDTQYADDMAKADQAFDELDGIADQADALGNVALKGGSNPLGGCATVTKDTVGTPDSLTIDFGSTNCLCKDGRYRRGKIIITQTGHYKDSAFNRTFGFSNYYVNNNQVYGSKSVTNMGHNSAGHMFYSIVVDGHVVLNSTNDTISHIANRTRTFTAGENTPQLSDDEYDITGSGSHTKATGKTYAMNITSPLHVALNCNWIKSGSISILPQGATFPRVLDYGNGNCDDSATITVNNKSKTIILK